MMWALLKGEKFLEGAVILWRSCMVFGMRCVMLEEGGGCVCRALMQHQRFDSCVYVPGQHKNNGNKIVHEKAFMPAPLGYIAYTFTHTNEQPGELTHSSRLCYA